MNQETSLMGADKTGGKKKSGKKKKKASKLSLNEKLLLKLEKGSDLLKANKYNYEHFVETADAWMIKYGTRCTELIKVFDAASDGIVSYDEFKSGESWCR